MVPDTCKRVAIYCRVSTMEQQRDGASLQVQERKCRAYAELHDLEIADVLIDAAQSAKDLNRPGMEQLREAVAAGAVDGVVIFKLDRLSRSVVDFGLLLRELDAAGVALMSVRDQLDTSSAAGRLVVNVMLSVSQWERETVGERTRDVLSDIRARGFHVGAIPSGYRRVEHEGAGCLLEPTDYYPTVAFAHALRSRGMSLRQAAHSLDAEGHRTPTGSTTWHPTTVSMLLRSPLLADLEPFGSGYKYSSRAVGRNESWKRLPGQQVPKSPSASNS